MKICWDNKWTHCSALPKLFQDDACFRSADGLAAAVWLQKQVRAAASTCVHGEMLSCSLAMDMLQAEAVCFVDTDKVNGRNMHTSSVDSVWKTQPSEIKKFALQCAHSVQLAAMSFRPLGLDCAVQDGR